MTDRELEGDAKEQCCKSIEENLEEVRSATLEAPSEVRGHASCSNQNSKLFQNRSSGAGVELPRLTQLNKALTGSVCAGS